MKELPGTILPRNEQILIVTREYCRPGTLLVLFHAASLGFASPQITDLKKYPTSALLSRRHVHSKPLLVTTGSGEKKEWRCGLPTKRACDEDAPFFDVDHLHSEVEEEGEGITSFFVRKSVYLAFLGRPATNSLTQAQTGHGKDRDEMQDVLHYGSQEGERERQALALQQEQQRIAELEREVLALQQQQERVAQLEREAMAMQQEQERVAQLEREREALALQQEQERVAQLERERKALALQQEQERVAQFERNTLALHQEQERVAQEPKRLEQEKSQQELEEQQNLEQQRKRENQQRLQQDELFEAEKLSTADRNVKRKTQIALARALRGSHPENSNRASDGRGKPRRGRSLERQREAHTQPSPVLELPLTLATELRTATSGEKRSNDSSVCISFKIRKDREWKSVLVLKVDRSDRSKVEHAAKKFMRQKLRLFGTNLRMLTLPECFETVVADRTNTILLIPETEIDISDELVTSASSVRTRALSRNKLSLSRINAHRKPHTLHGACPISQERGNYEISLQGT